MLTLQCHFGEFVRVARVVGSTTELCPWFGRCPSNYGFASTIKSQSTLLRLLPRNEEG